MKKTVLIALSITATMATGVVLAGMAFGFAWGLGDYSVGNVADFTGGWLLLVLMLVAAFVVPFFACRPFGRLWWISSLLAVLPTLLFLGGPIFTNVNMGHFAIALILPLSIIAAASFSGGLVGKKRIKSNNLVDPISEPAPLRDTAPEKGHE